MALTCATVLGACLALVTAHPADGADVRVAVAANFAATLAKMAPDFQTATGHIVRATAGSTGKLAAQIGQGAPFDVLMAADSASVERLVVAKRALADTRCAYATGRLALYSAQPGFVDAAGAVLHTDAFAHLAIANPKLAPYGVAAAAVMSRLGLASRLRPRLVVGENVAQAFQFVATGNAELGFVAWAQVVAAGQRGSAWLVPAAWHPALRQQAVVLAASDRIDAARAFVAWLQTPAAGAHVRAAGYQWEPRAR
ncbi:MAG: molybdate ABC transporter substrate-binding protein [Myxococcales bacterium]|nr:molybdate ABC transporter substrate-binding protein [Myxococcales bacterium]